MAQGDFWNPYVLPKTRNTGFRLVYYQCPCPSIDVMGRSIVTNTGRTQPVPQNTLQPMTFSAIPTSSNSANGSSSSYAGFSSVVAKRKSSDGSFSVKIVQARMTKSKAGGKIEFQRTGQAYVVTTERQASVDYILRECQSQFGDGHVLVTSDGLEINDSPGTRGQSNFACIQYICSMIYV